MPNPSISETPGGTTKFFKVRIDFRDRHAIYAIEAWLEAPNIIDAGEQVMTYFGPLAIEPADVTKLIEINRMS